MNSLLYLVPVLARSSSAAEVKALSLVKLLFENAGQFMRQFQSVGVAVASIFMLVIIFYYLTAILDGGKFQVKMLMPVVIYLFISNFSLVSRPVTAFVTALQRRCNIACEQTVTADLDAVTERYYTDSQHYMSLEPVEDEAGEESYKVTRETRKIWGKQTLFSQNIGTLNCDNITDAFLANKNKDLDNFAPSDFRVFEMAARRNWWKIFNPVWFTSSILKDKKKLKENPEDMEVRPLDRLGMKLMYGSQPGKFYFTKRGAVSNQFNFKAFILALFQFVCDIVEFMLKMLGALLIAILVAFGPLVWAFALLPGNGKFIMSWFLRLCQFALYSPIAAMIKGLGVKLYCELGNGALGAGAGSFIMSCGLILCIIVALTQVPSIAGVIVDGAQGGIQFSNGISTMTSVLSATSAVALAPAKLGLGVAGLATGNAGLASAGLGAFGGFAAGGQGNGGGGGNGASGQNSGSNA